MMATVTGIVWVERNARGDFFSSPDGRFDLMRAAGQDYWIAFDWVEGRKYRGTRLNCEAWCEGVADNSNS